MKIKDDFGEKSGHLELDSEFRKKAVILNSASFQNLSKIMKAKSISSRKSVSPNLKKLPCIQKKARTNQDSSLFAGTTGFEPVE